MFTVSQAAALHSTAEAYLATRNDYRAADREEKPAMLGCLQEAEKNLLAAARDAQVTTIVVGRPGPRVPQEFDDVLQLFGRTVIRVFDDGIIETFPIDVVVISHGESKYPVTIYSAEIRTKPQRPKNSENSGEGS